MTDNVQETKLTYKHRYTTIETCGKVMVRNRDLPDVTLDEEEA